MSSLHGNEQFYSRLPVNEISLSDLLSEEHLFYAIPADWHVLITDIRGSTKAIADGLHETINLLATGSIVAVLNRADRDKIAIPFFFGGDGASFIIPTLLLEPLLHALTLHSKNAQQSFGLDLRVGHVPVSDLYANGHKLAVSKWRTSKQFVIPIALGSGLAYAEQQIKGPSYQLMPFALSTESLDLTGMQCRWDKVQPPVDQDEVVSLLVVARDDNRQLESFKKVIDIVDRIYGAPGKRSPISVGRLRFNSSLRKLALEMQATLGKMSPLYLVRNWITAKLAPLYFRTKNGRAYLDQLVEFSDTLVIDGRINTVIAGNIAQREALVSALDGLEKTGEIFYGLYVSRESVMSCYVLNLTDKHIHFIDGAEGGYTRAAGMLKTKFAALTVPVV